MKNILMAIAAVVFLSAAAVLAAEEADPAKPPAPAADSAASKAADMFRKAVDLWLAVMKQTREEPDMISLLDELCREKGINSYREYSAAAEKELGAAWEEITQKEFHGRWAAAKVEYESFLRKVAEEEKAGEKDPRLTYVPDKAVVVYLKNGATIEGVARKGILSEKTVRVRKKSETKTETIYLQVPPAEKDAGIRVWYINMVDGFTFIQYTSIDEKQGVEVVRSLTPRESEQIFKDIKDKEETLRNAEKKAKAEEQRVGKERAEAEKAMRESDLAKKKGLDLEKARKERLELLTKFPPSAGWSSEKLAEIRRRWIINHIPPTEIERDFLSVFEKWQRAKDEQDLIDGKK